MNEWVRVRAAKAKAKYNALPDWIKDETFDSFFHDGKTSLRQICEPPKEKLAVANLRLTEINRQLELW